MAELLGASAEPEPTDEEVLASLLSAETESEPSPEEQEAALLEKLMASA